MLARAHVRRLLFLLATLIAAGGAAYVIDPTLRAGAVQGSALLPAAPMVAPPAGAAPAKASASATATSASSASAAATSAPSASAAPTSAAASSAAASSAAARSAAARSATPSTALSASVGGASGTSRPALSASSTRSPGMAASAAGDLVGGTGGPGVGTGTLASTGVSSVWWLAAVGATTLGAVLVWAEVQLRPIPALAQWWGRHQARHLRSSRRRGRRGGRHPAARGHGHTHRTRRLRTGAAGREALRSGRPQSPSGAARSR